MPASSFPSSVHTLVVGAGFAGIAAAIAVHRANPSADVLLIERADEVGGTWRDNTYPGCACDVPTSLYSFPSRRAQNGAIPSPASPRSIATCAT